MWAQKKSLAPLPRPNHPHSILPVPRTTFSLLLLVSKCSTTTMHSILHHIPPPSIIPTRLHHCTGRLPKHLARRLLWWPQPGLPLTQTTLSTLISLFTWRVVTSSRRDTPKETMITSSKTCKRESVPGTNKW